MLPIFITITSYDKQSNTCMATTENGVNFPIDPFVGCAIPLSDEEYSNDKGFSFVGNKYAMTHYTVYPDNVVPHENGLVLITKKTTNG